MSDSGSVRPLTQGVLTRRTNTLGVKCPCQAPFLAACSNPFNPPSSSTRQVGSYYLHDPEGEMETLQLHSLAQGQQEKGTNLGLIVRAACSPPPPPPPRPALHTGWHLGGSESCFASSVHHFYLIMKSFLLPAINDPFATSHRTRILGNRIPAISIQATSLILWRNSLGQGRK